MKVSCLGAVAFALSCVDAKLAFPTSLNGKSTCVPAMGTKSVKSIPTQKTTMHEVVTVTRPWTTTTVTTTVHPKNVKTKTTPDAHSVVTLTSIHTIPTTTTVNVTSTHYSTTYTIDPTQTNYVATKNVTIAATTSTIASTAGFYPAQSALVAASFAKRNAPKKYTTHVSCTAYAVSTATSYTGKKPTKIVTKTGVPTTITTSIKQKTDISTTHVSSAYTQTIEKTNTVQTTMASTLTRYHTTTATQTNYATPSPLAYYYEACGPTNLLNYTLVRGNLTEKVGIQTYQIADNSTLSASASDSAYSCCVKCIIDGDCAGSIYQAGTCFRKVDNGTCSDQGSNTFGSFKYTSNSTVPAGSGAVVSNGNCGIWGYGAAMSS